MSENKAVEQIKSGVSQVSGFSSAKRRTVKVWIDEELNKKVLEAFNVEFSIEYK